MSGPGVYALLSIAWLVGPPDVVAEPQSPWTVGAFVDTGYAVNSNFPENHVYRGTSTAPRSNEFTIHLAGAYVRHAPTRRIPVRIEMALQAGAAADALYDAEPDPGPGSEPTAGREVWKHLALANAGARIDRSGTELGAGLFTSPVGIGGFWTPFNWNVSPTWASNAAPFYFAGARVTQDLPVGFGLQAWVVNGWQTVGDTNDAPSYIGGVTWARGPWSAAHFTYFGPDDADLSPRAWRVHWDTFAIWDNGVVGVAAAWDVGRERRTDLPGEPVQTWMGGGLFAHGVVRHGKHVTVDVAGRPDAWFDSGGRIYGVPQWLLSGTGTVTVGLFEILMLRTEYRYDRSTATNGFFYAGDATRPGSPDLARSQHTFFFNVAAVFERELSAR